MRPILFNFLDYRLFLEELVQDLRQEGGWNLRRFASQAGIRAPGYLKMVIDGRRNLTGETARRFCNAFGIQGREKIYFERLVLYNQTADPDLKEEYYQDLISLRPRSAESPSLKVLNRYLSKPHNVCIREMVLLKDFREDYKWIARRCLPPIRPAQAREAILALLELGLLKRDETGKLIQVGGLVQTEDRNTQAVQAYHFHQAVLDQARQVMGHLDQEERHYQATTFALPRSLFKEFAEEFYRFREKILERGRENTAPADEVYQINFQIYPITKKGGVL